MEIRRKAPGNRRRFGGLFAAAVKRAGGPCLALACLHLHIAAAAEDFALEEQQEQIAITRCKALAESVLPKPGELPNAAKWRLLWQVPPGVPLRLRFGSGDAQTVDEASYWKQVALGSILTFQSEQEIKAGMQGMLDAMEAELVKEPGSGMGPGDGARMMWFMFSGAGAQPGGQEALPFTMVRGLGEVAGAQTDFQIHLFQAMENLPRDADGEVRQGDAEKAIQKALMAFPLPVPRDQVLDTIVKRLTLLKAQTRMEFMTCSDWDALAKALRTNSDDKDNIFEVGSYSVSLKIIDIDRVAEIKDLDAPGAVALQAKLNAGWAALVRLLTPIVQKEIGALQKQLDESAASPDSPPERRAALMKEIEEKTAGLAALGTVSYDVVRPGIGDDSYVIGFRIPTGIKGVTVVQDSGWLRNGHYLVEVRVAGNLPQKEVRDHIIAILKLVDARTRGFNAWSGK